jgi:hypothetical protein
VSSAPLWPHGDPGAVARTILAQPAYRTAPAASAPAGPSLWDLLTQFLARLFKPFFTWLHGVSGGSKPLGMLLGYVLAALVAAGLVYLILRIVNALASGRTGAVSARRGADAGALVLSRSTADWRALAERAAAAGNYAAAIAALFSAALALLDESALVPFDAARTPGEYRRLLRRSMAAASEPFDALADAFVRAAFDERPVSGDDYARALRAYDGLRPLGA